MLIYVTLRNEVIILDPKFVNLRIVVFQPEVSDGHVVRSVPVGPDPVKGEFPVGQPDGEPAFQQHVLALQHVQGLAGRLPGPGNACKK